LLFSTSIHSAHHRMLHFLLTCRLFSFSASRFFQKRRLFHFFAIFGFFIILFRRLSTFYLQKFTYLTFFISHVT
jgi:hypothetical protein